MSAVDLKQLQVAPRNGQGEHHLLEAFSLAPLSWLKQVGACALPPSEEEGSAAETAWQDASRVEMASAAAAFPGAPVRESSTLVAVMRTRLDHSWEAAASVVRCS